MDNSFNEDITKKHPIIKFIFTLFLGIIIGGATLFYLYNLIPSTYKKYSLKVKTKTTKKVITTKFSVDNYIVLKLYHELDVIRDSFYEKSKTKVKDIKSEDLQKVSYDNLRSTQITNAGVKVSDLEESFHNIFGEQVNYQQVDFIDNCGGEWKLDAISKTYKGSRLSCTKDETNTGYFAKINKAIKKDNTIYIYSLVGYYEKEGEKYTIKTNKNIDTNIGEYEKNETNIFGGLDYSLLNQYKYTYTLTKNNTYQFESVEIVK